jgi:hypothetical protein
VVGLAAAAVTLGVLGRRADGDLPTFDVELALVQLT